ncbi:hypothetical protein DUI87_01576 [Hirundo rustica rustica]|uniref:RNase H type-1 domain-containing protein n=1 Tax=Hirundo rustica rustica TaxID=333673 RepID=A0A3M0L9T2_HIRRU|nr:hypothetical protein DUI87_01576 [Hirundo rustica rustica]
MLLPGRVGRLNEVPRSRHWDAESYISESSSSRLIKIIIQSIEKKCLDTSETFGLSSEEEEQVTRAEEAPPYNELPETERQYALFTDGSCRIVGANRKWKAAVWSPTRRVAQATKRQGGSSQVAELKAIQLALDIAKREK